MHEREDYEEIQGVTEEEYNESNIPNNDNAMTYLEDYTRRLSLLEMEKRVLSEQHARRMAAVDRKIEFLNYFNESSVNSAVQKILAAQKGKSIDTPYMRISSRRTAGYARINDSEVLLKTCDLLGINSEEIFRYAVDASKVKKLIRYDNSKLYNKNGEVIGNPADYGLEIVNTKETVSFNLPKTGE